MGELQCSPFSFAGASCAHKNTNVFLPQRDVKLLSSTKDFFQ
jgi:hypothetical protein